MGTSREIVTFQMNRLRRLGLDSLFAKVYRCLRASHARANLKQHGVQEASRAAWEKWRSALSIVNQPDSGSASFASGPGLPILPRATPDIGSPETYRAAWSAAGPTRRHPQSDRFR